VRVVSGQAKGRRLVVPAGRGTRPTADRVREAIFDVLFSLDAVDGAAVADLFAGSGALGIEALSRGASRAVFVDRDRAAVASVRANLHACGFGPERASVVHDDVARWVARATGLDLVLADPPYGYSTWPALLAGLAPVAGLVVVESESPLDPGGGWRVLKEKRYGGTVVTVIRPDRQPARRANRKGDM
jgi:16S rRNA (guanine966-N2)-methyltransferase